MARPERNNVDYFPHSVVHGDKMFIVEDRYGNDGYALWFKLLEQLGKKDFHFIELDTMQKKYLSALFKVKEELMMEIIEELANIGAIHEDLFNSHNIIYSQKFVQSIADAYSRRTNKCMQLSDLCLHLQLKCKQKPCYCGQCGSINPQSIVEEIKLEETKEKTGYSFEQFWLDYDKKVGPKDRVQKKFEKLSEKDRNCIGEYIPKYKSAQPEKKFRKNPETFLNQKAWNDELINANKISNGERNRGAQKERVWNKD